MSNQIELTEKVATELAGALARLHELGDSKIINPANEAEITDLRRYISATLPQYANELLGNWFVMRNEYEPMIQGFSALLGRAGALINARQAKQQEKQPEATPENVVPLNQ
jgi:hypothetical protein